jgi:hypothetical protein
MMPAAYVVMERLPLTPNGKLDRRALPEPERVSEAERNEQSPVEEIVAGIFAQVLKLKHVGGGENFFELGGHSLLATQVVSRLRHAFGVEASLRMLFEAPTAAKLAHEIKQLLHDGLNPTAPPIVPIKRGVDLPLSFSQQRLWFMNQLDSYDTRYNSPFALRILGHLDFKALKASFNEIVRRHEVLRTTFQICDETPIQRIHPPSDITLPLIDLSLMPPIMRDRAARKLTDLEAGAPFNISVGPLLRIRLIQLGASEYILLATMHHIVCDGWSIGVLIREFKALYEAFSTGRRSHLEELSIQYADFAVWQREWLSGKVLADHLSYWRRQLERLEPLNLPTARVTPVTHSHTGGSASFRLSAELSEQLRELSQREGATLFMILLAAFKVVLSRWSRQVDIAVGTSIANRNRLETENLIGFFVNTLVLRTDLGGYPTFQELLRRVKKVVLDAYAHQDLPFEKVVEELAPERALNQIPLFQVLFIFQNAPVSPLTLSGIRVSSLPAGAPSSKVGLTFVLSETGGRIAGAMQYEISLYTHSIISEMLKQYEGLLEAVTKDFGARLNDSRLFGGKKIEELAQPFLDGLDALEV